MALGAMLYQLAMVSCYTFRNTVRHLGGSVGKHPALEFGSGYDFRVLRLGPALGSTLSLESA